MLRSFIRQLALLLFLAIGWHSAAQTPIRLYDSSHVRVIGKFISLYEDTSNRLGISEVSDPAFSANFRPSTTDVPNYNVTRSTIWSRMQFINHTSMSRWYLECSNPNVSIVEVYIEMQGMGYKRISSGFRTLPENRLISIHSLLFALDLPQGEPVTCFVAMNDILPLQINLSVGNSDRLFERYEAQDFLHGAFFGLLLMLVIYNFFIYVSVKDKVYLFYVVYVVANAWFISFLTGYGIHIPGVAIVLQRHPALVTYFLGAASCLFSIVFLDMKRTYRKGYKITVFMFFLLLTVPLLDFMGYEVESILLVQLYGLSFSIVSFIFGWIIYKRGYQSAKFYILGWTAYLIGLIMHISADLRLIPFNNFTHNSLEIFTAIEAILLSMAVGDKISLFKKEKEQAQAESLEAARKNEQLVREQNVVLAEKVKERTYELEDAKKIVEEKNKEILDSINYAQRIQYTLLAHNDLLTKNLPQHFVMFRPKDIVSGDFYWAAEKKDRFYIAVCDSTGHGVPGAFMSLLNISYLNEAVIEKNIIAPNAVLDHVRRRLIENLSQYGGQDGMDGVLLMFDRKTGNVTYAAAHNGVIVVNGEECKSYAADKMPIGKGETSDPFALRDVAVAKNGMLFLYTDGYADQFGGSRGKKFKYKQLDELLTSISHLSMEEQKARLELAFTEWKGQLEQVDDVCIIGIRL